MILLIFIYKNFNCSILVRSLPYVDLLSSDSTSPVHKSDFSQQVRIFLVLFSQKCATLLILRLHSALTS